MPASVPPTLTAPPPAPSRADSANFVSRGNAMMGWFATQHTDLVAALANVYANALAAFDSATAAADSQAAALASQNAAAANAQAAAQSAGASIWVSDTFYDAGVVRWSPITRYSYRRSNAGAGAVDPSADPVNWALAGAAAPQLVIVTGTTQAALANGHYALTNVAATTVTLPASPSAGDMVWITPGNSLDSNVIARNGEPIMSLAEDMTLNNKHATVALRYIDGALGWRIV